jgi:heptosyltransferase II
MKILVRGANWIGDAVMTIPALQALRKLYPNAAITLYTRSWAEGVFQDAEFIDRILTVDYNGSGFRDTYNESRRVLQGKYDLAVLFTNSFQTAAVVRLAGIKQRVGYSREGRGILLTDAIKKPDWINERHQVFYYLNIVEYLAVRDEAQFNFEDAASMTCLPVSSERREKARSRLAEAGVDPSRPTVAFGAGSTNSAAKRWGTAKYAKLADLFSGKLGANIVLLGSREEAAVAAQVAALSNADVIDLTGATDLATATAVLSEVDLFVSNDMGLAHLSAAVGTRTLVVFGPTNDVVTRPFAPQAEIIRHPVECSPCMLRTCPIDHRCMTRVATKTVFDAALAMLNG